MGQGACRSSFVLVVAGRVGLRLAGCCLKISAADSFAATTNQLGLTVPGSYPSFPLQLPEAASLLFAADVFSIVSTGGLVKYFFVFDQSIFNESISFIYDHQTKYF